MLGPRIGASNHGCDETRSGSPSASRVEWAARFLASTLILGAWLLAPTPPAWAEPLARPEGTFGRQVVVLEAPIEVPDYAFEERVADGTRVDRAMVEFRGRVVVLNFWATWCGVCARELPKLDAIAEGLAADGVDVVALSIDDDIAQAGRALAKRGHSKLRVFHDTSKVLSAILGVRGVPTTFVVGPDGRALAVVQGPAAWESPEALAWLRSLVGEGSLDRP